MISRLSGRGVRILGLGWKRHLAVAGAAAELRVQVQEFARRKDFDGALDALDMGEADLGEPIIAATGVLARAAAREGHAALVSHLLGRLRSRGIRPTKALLCDYLVCAARAGQRTAVLQTAEELRALHGESIGQPRIVASLVVGFLLVRESDAAFGLLEQLWADPVVHARVLDLSLGLLRHTPLHRSRRRGIAGSLLERVVGLDAEDGVCAMVETQGVLLGWASTSEPLPILGALASKGVFGRLTNIHREVALNALARQLAIPGALPGPARHRAVETVRFLLDCLEKDGHVCSPRTYYGILYGATAPPEADVPLALRAALALEASGQQMAHAGSLFELLHHVGLYEASEAGLRPSWSPTPHDAWDSSPFDLQASKVTRVLTDLWQASDGVSAVKRVQDLLRHEASSSLLPSVAAAASAEETWNPEDETSSWLPAEGLPLIGSWIRAAGSLWWEGPLGSGGRPIVGSDSQGQLLVGARPPQAREALDEAIRQANEWKLYGEQAVQFPPLPEIPHPMESPQRGIALARRLCFALIPPQTAQTFWIQLQELWLKSRRRFAHRRSERRRTTATPTPEITLRSLSPDSFVIASMLHGAGVLDLQSITTSEKNILYGGGEEQQPENILYGGGEEQRPENILGGGGEEQRPEHIVDEHSTVSSYRSGSRPPAMMAPASLPDPTSVVAADLYVQNARWHVSQGVPPAVAECAFGIGNVETPPTAAGGYIEPPDSWPGHIDMVQELDDFVRDHFALRTKDPLLALDPHQTHESVSETFGNVHVAHTPSARWLDRAVSRGRGELATTSTKTRIARLMNVEEPQ